jgi:hypothetical protein
MRTILLLLISTVVLFVFAGCGEQLTPTAALLTGDNVQVDGEGVEYVGRLGVQYEKTQAGLMSQWLSETDDDQQFYGLYIQQDLISDPNAPLLGNWYVGGQVSLDFDNDGGTYGPYIGTKSYIGGIEILTEFHYRHFNKALAALNDDDKDKYKLYIGPAFRF